MKPDKNPFEYEAANNLTDEMIVDYYIDDFNYSRFIQSKRNIFLVGERGSGKTMALLYNRWRVQKLLAEKKGEEPSLSTIGVYIPCNTPLTHKTEYQLLEDFLASVLSEHFLVLSIAYGLADTLSEISDVLNGADEQWLRDEVSFVLGADLPKEAGFFEALKRFLHKELLDTQRTINSRKRDAFYDNTLSFASVFVPLLNMCSKKIPHLLGSHFLLLLDDVQTLNKHQLRALNSWIAYRDHSLFSFKVAVAKVGGQTKIASSGESILEGHDYTKIDLEARYQNKNSDFYHLAKTLITRRLENKPISATPEEFFPTSPDMEKDLKDSEQKVRKEAVNKFGKSEDRSKAITDYIYKYRRAHYFKNRPSKANRPPYSGFETLVFLSTGIVRNLLEPCYWMFDKAVSEANEAGDEVDFQSIFRIKPSIQTDIILGLSQRKWDWLKDEIVQDIEGCSTENGQRAYRLLDALAKHFRHRLLNHQSEPCALSFTISEQEQDVMRRLDQIIEILRKAQLLFIRSGPAKDEGQRETYYIPNKILWPIRGLDPHGQHARVSIPASVLWEAAERGKIEVDKDDNKQFGLWGDGE